MEETNNLSNSELEDQQSTEEVDFTIDFVTSSAISRMNIKFIIIYLPILWLSGYMAVSVFFDLSSYINNWIITMLLLPFWLFILYFIFTFGVAIFTKAFLLIINMIHTPKEGVFKAEEGNPDYEFWRLRVESKKLAIWLMSRSFLPWIVMWGFRWFGVRIDFSSHLQEAWVDTDFINFGRKVTVGQGAVVMSSMVIGKYLIIKRTIFDDYTVIGGVSNIAPGTFVGKDTVIGAFSTTTYDQILDQGWIYFGIPAIKLKPNKYAEERRDVILRRLVDDEKKFEEKHEINIDDDKKQLANNNSNIKE